MSAPMDLKGLKNVKNYVPINNVKCPHVDMLP